MRLNVRSSSDVLAKKLIEVEGKVITKPIRNYVGSATKRSIRFSVRVTLSEWVPYEEVFRCVAYGDMAKSLRGLKRGHRFVALTLPRCRNENPARPMKVDYEVVSLPPPERRPY